MRSFIQGLLCAWICAGGTVDTGDVEASGRVVGQEGGLLGCRHGVGV